MDNIIIFPKNKKQSPPQTIDELIDNVVETRKAHAEYIIDELMPEIYSYLHSTGVNLESEGINISAAFMEEALRALVLQSYKIEHPFSVLARTFYNADLTNKKLVINVNDINSVEDEASDLPPAEE